MRAAIFCLALLPLLPLPSRAEEAHELPTVILAVQGDGSTVRRKSRIEESARVGAKVYPGEIVQTGPRSSVQLMTTDGSLIKVGFGSKLKVEESTVSGSFVTWVGNLILGRVRALVTKQPGQAPRFKVHTPTASMGVRGTEFVAVHDEASETTYLYTLEGVMGFGQHDCDAAVSCLEVRAGETSVVRKGAPPTNPSAFDVKELVRGKGGKEQEAAEISLFKDARQAEIPPQASESEMRKLVADSAEELADGQDRALGRTKEERIAINQAVANGTFVSVMRAADSYAQANHLDLPDLGGAEDQVGATASDKFRLGAAVLQAKKDGLFVGTRTATGGGTRVAGDSYVLAKTVDFSKASLLKNTSLRLSSASSTYLGSLSSTAEITGTRTTTTLSGMTVSSGTLSKATLSGSTLSATRLSTTTRSGSTLSATNTASRTLNLSGTTSTTSLTKLSTTTASSATKSVTLTGTTTTLSATDTKLLSGTKVLAETTVDSTVSKYTRSTAIKTSTLSKISTVTKSSTSSSITTTSVPKTSTTISGGTCYTTKQTCKLIPCSGYTTGGKVCTGGSKTECTSTKVAIPCK